IKRFRVTSDIERGSVVSISRIIPAQAQFIATLYNQSLSCEQWEGHRQESLGVQEFQTVYQENIHLIYRYIYGKVGNREEAEDLTSQTFIKAVRYLDQERNPHSIQKWLLQIARTTVADYWRTYYRISSSSLEELLNAGWEGPVDEATSSWEELTAHNMGTTERVQHILAALPNNYREVLTCRFLYNLSIKETAQRLALTEANVKVLQFRALKRAAELDPQIARTSCK
ncbi:MAG TPA: sigma-70 family RNA polymerase sigma factor, partial [Ktedonobacteraceae bacterium]